MPIKYITDWKGSDEEIKANLLKNKEDYDEQVTQVRYLISELKGFHNSVLSYPSDALEIFKKENPTRRCKTYRYYRDGWGCIYENICCIELL